MACCVAVTPAMAYDDVGADIDKTKGGGFVGFGLAVNPDYEGSEDYEVIPAPFGAYHWANGRYVNLGGTSGSERAARLSVNLLTNKTAFELGPVLQYRMERDSVDNNKVDKLNKIGSVAETGAFLGWQGDHFGLSTTFAADTVSSEHQGYLWYFNADYKYPVTDSFTLALGAHLTWADEDYMDAYFGVRPKESAKSGLRKFSADSGFKDTGISLTGHYKFNDTWGIAANVAYTRMLGDAEDSPIVEDEGDKNQYGGVIAMTYSF